MPEAYSHWKCNKCGKRFPTYDAADACEVSHIIQGVTDKFASDLAGLKVPTAHDISKAKNK